MTRAARPSHIALSKMVAAMVSEPQSIDDLVEVSGLCVTTVRHYVLTLRKEKGVRIAEWQASRRGHLAVAAYAIGNRPDAVRPKNERNDAGKRWQAWEQKQAQKALMQRIAA
jgi:hypothetical protein